MSRDFWVFKPGIIFLSQVLCCLWLFSSVVRPSLMPLHRNAMDTAKSLSSRFGAWTDSSFEKVMQMNLCNTVTVYIRCLSSYVRLASLVTAAFKFLIVNSGLGCLWLFLVLVNVQSSDYVYLYFEDFQIYHRLSLFACCDKCRGVKA